ncbi:SAM-dependent methyltransferase [Amycolatopsis sp. H20-H5]|uniref:SAM-dependent methyltransferase n=1 Tax=Amycolatopsis sp. H20-H5 TaxID=3046309 RepID=UPI002DBD9D69|nr:class I SAM-dependent methyltransferase [Amycolatopsis sp. H20-H5]MEC3980518.1 class I SAM-dependent methyltransferase [Amycolatopsis sp. H20-H5]
MSTTHTRKTGAGRRPAFDLFEGYAVSSILASFEMSGLLDGFEADGLGPELTGDRPPDAAALLRASLRYLAQRGIATEENGTFTLTAYGREVVADKGYLVWLVGGYGSSLRRVDGFLTGGQRYGVDHVRDGKWVAGGAALLGGKDVVPVAMELLGEIEFGRVLDLGCGNARLLAAICRRFGAGGVGIDNSPEACADARKLVEEAKLGGRIVITEADAGALGEIDAVAGTDLVVTFFLLHEILASGVDVLLDYLKQLAATLPAGAYVLTAEVEPAAPAPSGPELFTPEFTYVHALMRQILLPEGGWVQLFEQAGFTVRAVRRNDMPGGILLLAQTAG